MEWNGIFYIFFVTLSDAIMYIYIYMCVSQFFSVLLFLYYCYSSYSKALGTKFTILALSFLLHDMGIEWRGMGAGGLVASTYRVNHKSNSYY